MLEIELLVSEVGHGGAPLPYLNVRRHVGEEAAVYVSRHHRTRRTDALGQPPSDRARPCAELQTTPSNLDADLLAQQPAGVFVEDLLQSVQPEQLRVVRRALQNPVCGFLGHRTLYSQR